MVDSQFSRGGLPLLNQKAWLTKVVTPALPGFLGTESRPSELDSRLRGNDQRQAQH